MVPFFIFYSMFGFQRVGDLIWCAGDSRVQGFLVGGTSGRTTLNGEGLQHQDGHSQLAASAVPNIIAYDPAYAYELAVIIQNGLQRMYVDHERVFYYLSVYNENYEQPPMPEGVTEGILKGMYRLASTDSGDGQAERPQLFGSGTILPEVRRAQELLKEKYGIGSDVWSVTSYSELARDAQSASRWNWLHPGEATKQSFLEQSLAGVSGPVVAASDNVRLVPDQIREWVPGTYIVLGTDGYGRSDAQPALRRHFEIDAECTAYAAISGLAERGQFPAEKLPGVIRDLGIDPEKVEPRTA